MRHFLLIAGMAVCFCACKKENAVREIQSTPDKYLATVKAALKDSLSANDYQSLDFSRTSVSTIDSLHTSFVRIAVVSKSLSSNFFIAKTDLLGQVLKGRFVQISRDSTDVSEFSGSIQYRNLKGASKPAVKFVKGKLLQASASQVSSLMADGPVVDGGDLPPVIVSYSPGGDAGISYADWYNLMEMAGDNGSGYTGYYSPSSGGGGGGNGSAPTEQVDFEAPESKEAITIKKYIDCFGATQEATATYTLTIAVDLPVDADPSKFFNWSEASPGHTFVEFYKNGSNGLVEQNFGFYPNTSWKTVVGPDNIASKIVDDGGHEYQAKYEISVSASQFQNALKAAQNYSAYQYNVAQFNCADYALKVFNAAGGTLNVPRYTIPGFPSNNGSNTPEGVYDAIKNLVLAGKPNAMANGQKQWVGDSHGACD